MVHGAGLVLSSQLAMDELCRIVRGGEQCLSWELFQLVVRECEGSAPAGGVVGEEEEGVAAAAVREVPVTVPEASQLQSPATVPGFEAGGQAGDGEVQVLLENRELWKQFNKITNEMIVTKAGRYVF